LPVSNPAIIIELIFSLDRGKIGCPLLTSVKITEITGKGVRGLRNGRLESFAAETIVLAMGMKSEKQVADGLRGMREVYVIGDCVEPQNIREAIAEGYMAGLKV
jgi:thioredoxin reductase